MKFLLFFLFWFFSICICNAQSKQNIDRCLLLQTLLNDSAIINNIFINNESKDTFNIIDTKFYFKGCLITNFKNRYVLVVHKENSRNNPLKEKDRIDFKVKVVYKKLMRYKIYFHCLPNNLAGNFEYKYSNKKFILLKHKLGYY
jgi:hypothetical protein